KQSLQSQDSEETIGIDKRLLDLEPALKRRSQNEYVRGALWIGLGQAYQDRIQGNRADNLEEAITAYIQAQAIFTREFAPREWAHVQRSLADTYSKRIRGERVDNLEKAIAAYEASLGVYTREALPQDWAATQNNLGCAYRDRIRGDRADNL